MKQMYFRGFFIGLLLLSSLDNWQAEWMAVNGACVGGDGREGIRMQHTNYVALQGAGCGAFYFTNNIFSNSL